MDAIDTNNLEHNDFIISKLVNIITNKSDRINYKLGDDIENISTILKALNNLGFTIKSIVISFKKSLISEEKSLNLSKSMNINSFVQIMDKDISYIRLIYREDLNSKEVFTLRIICIENECIYFFDKSLDKDMEVMNEERLRNELGFLYYPKKYYEENLGNINEFIEYYKERLGEVLNGELEDIKKILYRGLKLKELIEELLKIGYRVNIKINYNIKHGPYVLEIDFL